MPTYEYRCGACEHAFERFQKISDDPVRTCPECGEDEVERLISPGGGLVFRGSGFYATDYRETGPGDAGRGGEPEGASGSDDGGDGASDAGSAGGSAGDGGAGDDDGG